MNESDKVIDQITRRIDDRYGHHTDDINRLYDQLEKVGQEIRGHESHVGDVSSRLTALEGKVVGLTSEVAKLQVRVQENRSKIWASILASAAGGLMLAAIITVILNVAPAILPNVTIVK